MPTYEFYCKSCGKNRQIVCGMADFDDHREQKCNCGTTMTQRFFASQVLFKDDPSMCGPGQESTWPGKQIKREAEDNYIRSASKRARELKASGKVKMEDVLTFKDTDKLNPE